MKKIAYNSCFGGFGLSHEATMEYARRKGITLYPFVDKRDANGRTKFGEMVPYLPSSEDPFVIHYYTAFEPGNEHYWDRKIPRDDPDLLAIIEEWGERANGRCAALTIVEIPDDVDWEIDEYDGNEWVAEKHRRWE